MSAATPIQWADASWSPWEGCSKISPGCDNCYAEAMNRWLRKGRNWGSGAPRRIYSDEHWWKPRRWDEQAGKAGKPRSVFPSVCDPFDNEAPEGQRWRFFDLIAATPSLTWLLLTKRIGNVRLMVPDAWIADWPANVWIGATVVNQEEVDRDVPKLLRVPARTRFLSCEPLLSRIDLCETFGMWWNQTMQCLEAYGQRFNNRGMRGDAEPGIAWVIVGGESGRSARPFQVEWARDIVAQCRAAGVPVFVKQLGARPQIAGIPIRVADRAGGEPAEWPDDLRVREFPA